MTKSKRRNIVTKNLNLLLIFLIVLYNNETFPSINFIGGFETIFLLTGMLSGIFSFFIFFKKIELKSEALMILVGLIFLILFSMLINEDFIGGYIKIILGLYIGFILIHLMTFESFIENFTKVMVFISGYSVFLLVIIKPFISILPEFIFPGFTNSSGVPFINGHLSVFVNLESYYRNFGIFREPGVYQIFLNFAIIFELFFKKSQPRFLRIIILYVAIISTFSTPGYIVAAVLIVTFIFNNYLRNDKSLNFRKVKQRLNSLVILLIISSIYIFISNDLLNVLVADTINKVDSEGLSYQGRIMSVLANLEIGFQSPFIGSGISKGLSTFTLTEIQYGYGFSTSHNTSTLGAWFSVFGLFFTASMLFLFLKLLGKSTGNLITRIIVLLSIMFIINTQLIIYNELLYVILFFGVIKFPVKYNIDDERFEKKKSN